MADNEVSFLVKLKDQFSTGINKIIKGFTGLDSTTAKTTVSTTGLGVAFGNILTKGISMAVDGLITLGKEAVKTIYEFEKGEMVTARLNAALKSQGITSQYVAEDLDNYAKSMRSISGVDDDVYKEGMRLLVNFGLLGDELKAATNAAYELSIGYGTDLRQSFQLLARAYENGASSLTRYGVSVDTSKSKSEQFAAALEQIHEKYGDLAGANADNLITKTQVLKEEWQEFKEDTLEGLAPLLTSLISKANEFVESMSYMHNRTEEQERYQELLEQEVRTKELLAKAETVEKYGANKGYITNLRERLAAIQDEMSAIEKSNYEKLQQAKIDKQRGEEQIKQAQERAAVEKKLQAEQEAAQKKQEAQIQRLNDFAVNARQDRYNKISAIISTESAAEQAALIASQQREYEGQLAAMEARLALLDEGNQKEAELIKELNEEKKVIREEFDEYNAELDALQEENKIAAADADIARAQQLAELEKQFSNDKYLAAKDALSNLATFQTAKSKELAVLGKTMAIAQATINTYEGATKALAQGGIFGIAYAATVIAAGLANVAQIAGVEFAVGTPYVPEDMPATVHQGEIIVPRTFSEGLRSGDLVMSATDDIGRAGGDMVNSGNVSVNFNGDVLADNPENIARKLADVLSRQIAGGQIAPLPTGERM